MTAVCRKCGQEWPRTTEYWQTHKACKDGMRKTCRQCLGVLSAVAARKRWEETKEERTAARKEKQKEYRKTNAQKYTALWDAWYEKNRENNLEAKKRYRQRPDIKAREKKRNREYQIQNRERLNLYARARRYRLGVDTYLKMIEEQNG